MAQYHKIPQNVTTYQGRIVGRFTAKQFIFLAVGGILIFIVLNMPLGNTLKFFITAVIAGISLLFALAEVEGRSIDQWIQNFLTVVNRPTQRIWSKSNSLPSFLRSGYHPQQTQAKEVERDSGELERFIRMWRPREPVSDLTDREKEVLSRVRSYKKEATQTRQARPVNPGPAG